MTTLITRVDIATREHTAVPGPDRSGAGTKDHRAETRELLFAENIRATRMLVGNITHSFNSALQSLGDALFAVREDALALADAGDRSVPSPSSAQLGVSLHLADYAAGRLGELTDALPHLVVDLDAGHKPINVHTELVGVVALTWGQWHRRAEMLIEIDPNVATVCCEWWIVRFGVQRLILWATNSTGARQDRRVRATVCVAATKRGDLLEIAVRIPHDGVRTRAVLPPDADTRAHLDACAEMLDGAFTLVETNAGLVEARLSFPVHSAERLIQ